MSDYFWIVCLNCNQGWYRLLVFIPLLQSLYYASNLDGKGYETQLALQWWASFSFLEAWWSCKCIYKDEEGKALTQSCWGYVTRGPWAGTLCDVICKGRVWCTCKLRTSQHVSQAGTGHRTYYFSWPRVGVNYARTLALDFWCPILWCYVVFV